MVGQLVARRHLELSVGIAATIGEFKCSCRPRGDRRNDKVVGSVALFVGDSQQQACKNLAIEFQIPGGTAWASKVTNYFVLIKQRTNRRAVLAKHSDSAIRKVGKRRS